MVCESRTAGAGSAEGNLQTERVPGRVTAPPHSGGNPQFLSALRDGYMCRLICDLGHLYPSPMGQVDTKEVVLLLPRSCDVVSARSE